jgi:serine/threonine-protein kinase
VEESERLASVDHPNIIPVFEAGQDGDHLFIAMRYVDSTDLRRLIADEGPLAIERTVTLVIQVADALDAAHAKGLVHRDVKPANVLVAVGPSGDHAYLSDFGLTKRTDDTSGLTKTGSFMGTIDYVAPEQISGRGVDGRTDQYALTCVMFQCLTGRPPYQSGEDAAVLYSHLSEAPPSVAGLRPEIDTVVDTVLARGMAKEKADRYPSCLALADAARAALLDGTADRPLPSGSRVTARRATAEHTLGSVAAPGRHRRWLAIVTAAAVAVIAIVLGGAVLLGGNGEGTPPATGGLTTLVALDAASGRALETLHDRAFSEHLWGVLSIEDGSLWQATPDELVRRDVTSGAIEDTIPLPANWWSLDGGFGFVWAAVQSGTSTEISRISPISGRAKTVEIDGELTDLRTGNGSVWILMKDGSLVELDPVSTKVVDTFDTGAVTPGSLSPLAGYVWICECESGRVVQFDPRKDEITLELELPEQGYMIGVDSTTVEGERVWLLDPEANTLTPIDPKTGEVGRSLGVGGARITDAKVVGDSMWVSSQTQVTRIVLETLDQHVIDVPDGISAGSVAPLPDGSGVWVANCGCPIEG